MRHMLLVLILGVHVSFTWAGIPQFANNNISENEIQALENVHL